MNNPFLIKGYDGPEYFCDRKNETQKLTEAIHNSRNVTLISERRLGKTTLLNHVAHQLQNELTFIFIDLYATTDLKSFVQLFTTKVLEKLEPFSEKAIRKITQFFAALKPRFSFDPQTGTPSIELSVENTAEAEKSVSLLFKYILESKQKVVVVFDEFQQILRYPEKNIEALLRTEIQKDPQSSFVFSGSQTHLLQAMFNQYSRPFYNSSQMLFLEKINRDEYVKFIAAHFASVHTKIESATAQLIYDLNNGITYNVQFVCNKLFAAHENHITDDFVKQVIDDTLKENEITYYNYRELMTTLQFKLVTAVAKENEVEKPFSTSFLSKYKLGSPSSVRSAVNTLSEKGILVNNRGLRVNDWFFNLWLQKQL